MRPAPVSLCMIVCNAGKVIERCLRSVMDHVEEVIIVDTGSDDDTKAVIERVCPKARVIDFTHDTHPESFILDVEASWERKLPGPFTGKWRLGDFAAARQVGWQEGRAEYLFWIDADDTVEGADKLTAVTTSMRERSVNVAMLNYDYDHDGQGNVIMKLPRERIVKRSIGSFWSQPVHEVCMPSGLGTFYDQVNIVHHRTRDKLPVLWHNRNLKILVKWFEQHRDEVEKNTVDPRMLFYMGMEARFQWPEYALDCFKKYVRRSGWDEERAQAHYLSGTIHERAGRYEEAKGEFAMMTVEFPKNADGFFGLARCAYHTQDWGKTIEWTERGFEVNAQNQDRPTMLMEDPHDRKWRPHVFMSAALVNERKYSKAIEICEEGLQHHSTEPHLLGNLKEARKQLGQQEKSGATMGFVNLEIRLSEPISTPPLDIPHDVLAFMAMQLWKRTLIEDGALSLQLLSALPKKIREEKKVVEAIRVVKARLAGSKGGTGEVSETPSSDNSAVVARSVAAPLSVAPVAVEVGKRPMTITIWTGPAWEPWSPASLQTGIGGSETAAIFMAAELARRGHKVWLLGMHDGREGEVEYVHHDRGLKQAGPWKNVDVFVTSRQPGVLLDGGFNWQASYVWCHDIHCGASVGVKEALLKADAVLALSRWHKGFLHDTYRFLGDEHVIVTRNGIAAGRFGKRPNKVGNKLVYASSPDRGIERLLEVFPLIRAQVPNAELEVYYGFDTWRSMCLAYSDKKGLEKIAYYEALLTKNAPPGVRFMGRVGQQQLADAYLKAKVWAYPTWFSETSCISAMEAQAAGCVPVTSALAALEETVKHGFLLRGADNTKEYQTAFVETVVKLLKDETLREEYASAGRQWALHNLGWDLLAQDWEAMFLAQVAKKGRGAAKLALPAYAGL